MEQNSVDPPVETATARLIRQQRSVILERARDKVAARQTLTVRELRELNRFEAEQRARYGRPYLAAMPKTDYVDLCGRQARQLLDWAQRYGYPYPLPRHDPVDVGRVLRWFHDFLAVNAGLLANGNGEDQVLQLASGKLKDEFVRRCIEGKEIDNDRKRIELANLAEQAVPVEPLRYFHNRLADRIRRVREKFAKRFEGENLEFAEQLFDDMIDDIERMTDDYFTGNSDAEPDVADDGQPVGADPAP